MSRIKRTSTSAEVLFRKAARAAGVRLAAPRHALPGSPDLVNLSCHLAVFVHGCFWHAHDGCIRATVPKRNRSFWIAKFHRNRERDHAVVLELRRLGFRVVTVWECEINDPVLLALRTRSVGRLIAS